MAVGEQTSEWVAGAAGSNAEIVDYGLWIDGEMLSEKDELEGTRHE